VAETKKQSPVNIVQNRAVGQDSPVEGSHIGREADKSTGYPGSPVIGTNEARRRRSARSCPPSSD
jgi:hypothetical protein